MLPSIRLRFIPLAPLFLVSLAACAPTTRSPVEGTATPTFSGPRTAARTATPTPSLTPTATLTSTAIPSPSPTAGPNFKEASIYAMAHLSDGRLLITIRVPGGVDGIFDAYIGDQIYPCEVLRDHPDRLYCVGPEPYVNYKPTGTEVRLLPLYPDESATPLFRSTFTVPAQSTPTPTPPITFFPTPGGPLPPIPPSP